MPVTRSKLSSICVSREQAPDSAQYPPSFSMIYRTQLERDSMGKSSAHRVPKTLFGREFNEDRCKITGDARKVWFSPLSLKERIMYAKGFLNKKYREYMPWKPHSSPGENHSCQLPMFSSARILCVHGYGRAPLHTDEHILEAFFFFLLKANKDMFDTLLCSPKVILENPCYNTQTSHVFFTEWVCNQLPTEGHWGCFSPELFSILLLRNERKYSGTLESPHQRISYQYLHPRPPLCFMVNESCTSDANG